MLRIFSMWKRDQEKGKKLGKDLFLKVSPLKNGRMNTKPDIRRMITN